VPINDIPDDEALSATASLIDDWCAATLEAQSALVAVERHQVTDGTASERWYLRFKGEEKDAITLWLTMRQRTLHHEVQFMPEPEVNVAEVYRYVLACNAELFQMAFCLGPENAIYLVGRTPIRDVDHEALDRIAGSSLRYVDDHFQSAMSIGYPDVYRRRPRR
jgi:Putative bacterial sensory transduction regulator